MNLAFNCEPHYDSNMSFKDNVLWVSGLIITVMLVFFIIASSEWWQGRHYIWKEKLFHEWWLDWRPLAFIGLFMLIAYQGGWLTLATVFIFTTILVIYAFYLRWKKKEDLMWKDIKDSIGGNGESNGRQ